MVRDVSRKKSPDQETSSVPVADGFPAEAPGQDFYEDEDQPTEDDTMVDVVCVITSPFGRAGDQTVIDSAQSLARMALDKGWVRPS